MSNAASDARLAAATVGVSVSRDLDRTAAALGAWLRERMRGADAVEITSLRPPTNGGGSSETFFATLAVTRRGARAVESCVLRIKPTDFRLFLRDNFDEQQALIRHLAASGAVPVPSIRFYEPNEGVLGAPFWIMDRVEGQVPPDNPSYNVGGFVAEAPIERRRALWRDGVETLAKLARVDLATLPRLVDREPGQSGLDENLRHWTDSMMWACDGRPTALLDRAADWLWANKPAREETGLSWGDARIGNMIFRDWRCAAVIDWEAATLAGAQLDLAHWLVMDDYNSTCVGAARLPGLGDRAETIALWEALTGRAADQLDWHEVLAVFRLTVLMVRYATLWRAAGRDDVTDAAGDTLMSRHLRRTLARVAGDS